MEKSSSWALITTALLGALAFSQVHADPVPEGAKPLSEVIKTVEDQGYSPVSEVSMDDGVWEIEAKKDGERRELRVDPSSMEILSDRPED